MAVKKIELNEFVEYEIIKSVLALKQLKNGLKRLIRIEKGEKYILGEVRKGYLYFCKNIEVINDKEYKMHEVIKIKEKDIDDFFTKTGCIIERYAV